MQGGETVSLFPFVNTGTVQTTTTNLPIFKEYDWDFTENSFKLKDGKFVIVEKLDALKIWVKKALLTPRFRYLAYSWDYGHELENLVGSRSITSDMVNSETKRYVEEAIKINSYIESIKSFTATLSDSVLKLDFTIITIYGEVDISV